MQYNKNYILKKHSLINNFNNSNNSYKINGKNYKSNVKKKSNNNNKIN